MDPTLTALFVTAATIGLVHTLAGPDHYVPFIAMARARDWSARRTVAVTLACGTGHVAGSVLLGVVGISIGLGLGRIEVGWMERFESVRGTLAGWLLIGFGLAYAAWGLRRAWKGRTHSHWHHHGDGTVHDHQHGHEGAHAHPHTAEQKAKASITPWVLFTIFVFGPCEPLIPVLMVPAAQGSWWAVAAVAGVFGLCTLAAMTIAVVAGYYGLAQITLGSTVERYSHALAGAALAACGLAVQLGL